jgi:S1-C subfamily serine protease
VPQPRHAAPDAEAAADELAAPADDPADYARPAGVPGSFVDPPTLPAVPWAPPPATADERTVFGRPAPDVVYAPREGERLPPRHAEQAPVPAHVAAAFAAPPGALDGYAPAPNSRVDPSTRPAESPWWRRGAADDPWRDPNSPFWLGSGAVFPAGLPLQLEPELDTEALEFPPPPEEAEPKPAPVSVRVGRRLVALLALAGLVIGAVGGGVGYLLARTSRDTLHRADVHLGTTGTPANRPPGSVADIAKRVGPAVVSIAVTTSSEFAVGSGVVIDKNGYVLTNDHVINAASGGKGTVVVTFADEATATGRIVGEDPASDLAVLKVPADQLTVASLGNSAALAVGDPVIAIGSPLALQGTVTSGIVSALNRPVHITDDTTGPGVYLDAIQTDAPINHGNSGGALVDASGAVVGINSAAALSTPGASGSSSSVSGIGFAIPINYARGIAEQLIRSGKAVHATLGVQGRSATTPDGLQQGAYLEQITDGGPAAKAGLQPGDVVLAADGHAVPSYDELVVLVQQHKPGDVIPLTFVRGTGKHTVRVTLSSG